MQLDPRYAPRLETDNFRFVNTSEAVQSLDYSKRLKILEVEFISREVYHYLGVTPTVWQKIQDVIESGESLGAFVNTDIKPRYDYYRLIT